MTAPQGPGVLIVEDDARNQVALCAALEPLGVPLAVVGSGEEALKHLLSRDELVIVLDVQLPGLDGFETAAAIKGRERSADIPILFVTAINRSPEHRRRGYETGAVDYLFKPVEPDLLLAKVSVLLELQRSRRELARSNADLEQFAYVAAHDLQEPLRVVAGYLELLEERTRGVLDEKSRGWVEAARASAVRMSELVAGLLAYARAGAGAPALEPVSLEAVVARAVAAVRPLLREAGAEVQVGELPDVLATERELAQVVQNLLANAVQNRGAAPPVVTIDAARDGGWVRVRVRDNGVGIDPAAAARVFGMFERLDSSPYPGTGLGLAICRRIIERHGGEITLAPNGDQGATVSFTLPAAT